jgi:DNA-binding GntR family transcriptional regulator
MARRSSTTRIAGSRQRRTAVASEQAAYQRIIAAVTQQRLAPGLQLKEEKLARIFRISRTRVRKVLARLADEGVVTLEPNRGAFVARPPVEEARDVFEARRAVESYQVRIVAERPVPAGLDRLRAFLPEEREAFAARRPGASRFAGEFHLILADLAGNAVLTDVLRRLIHRTSVIQALYGPSPGHLCLVHEHERLIELLAAGQADDAVKALVDHLDRIEASLNLARVGTPVADLAAILAVDLAETAAPHAEASPPRRPRRAGPGPGRAPRGRRPRTTR